MNASEIKRIESTLGLPLPSDYRSFLGSHADEVEQLDAKLETIATLWTDVKTIIAENTDVESSGDHLAIGGGGSRWPANYLLVGTNGAGPIY